MPREYFHLINYQEGATILLSDGVVKGFDF